MPFSGVFYLIMRFFIESGWYPTFPIPISFFFLSILAAEAAHMHEYLVNSTAISQNSPCRSLFLQLSLMIARCINEITQLLLHILIAYKGFKIKMGGSSKLASDRKSEYFPVCIQIHVGQFIGTLIAATGKKGGTFLFC